MRSFISVECRNVRIRTFGYVRTAIFSGRIFDSQGSKVSSLRTTKNQTAHVNLTLRKHAYSNILKISPPKTESFQIKYSDIFHISAQNIYCGYPLEPPRRGGSNEYPQSMFLSRNKKLMYTLVNSSFLDKNGV